MKEKSTESNPGEGKGGEGTEWEMTGRAQHEGRCGHRYEKEYSNFVFGRSTFLIFPSLGNYVTSIYQCGININTSVVIT